MDEGGKALIPPGQAEPEAMRRALEAQVERLRFLIEASKALNSTLDLAELITIVLDISTRGSGAERATLFLLDAERGELWSLVAQGLGHKEIRLPSGRGLAGWVATTGEVVNLADAHEDPRFDRSFDELFGYRTRTLLVAPVKDRDGRIVGVLELLNKPEPGFTRDDVELIDGISVHAALALDNARLHRDSLERQRMDRELTLAHSIQRGLFPESPPVLPEFDIAIRHQSSRHVGGDYYDFMTLDASTQLFVVADVEGKGVASALVMSNLQATLHAVATHVHSLEGMMYHVNEGIRISTRGEKYMTLFLGLIDVPRRKLHYVNAGHLPPMIVSAAGELEYLREGGMVVGLMPQVRYRRGHVQLHPGDVVLAFTDGITEASNRQDEQFGAERLARAAAARVSLSAQQIVDGLFEEVSAFAAGGVQQDDKVLMAIKVR